MAEHVNDMDRQGPVLPEDWDINELPLDDALFLRLTRYANASDNMTDNLKRATLLGFGDRGVMVAPGALIRVQRKGAVGDHVFIGLYSYVNGDVRIGEHTLIGPHCSLSAGNHRYEPETGWFSGRTEPLEDSTIRIGAGSWLASHVVVTAGVTVGRANLICAGAVVTKDTPDHAIVAGIPARVVGAIDPETGAYTWFQDKDRSD